MKKYPKIGIRPTIDGRQGGVRESLEEKTICLLYTSLSPYFLFCHKIKMLPTHFPMVQNNIHILQSPSHQLSLIHIYWNAVVPMVSPALRQTRYWVCSPISWLHREVQAYWPKMCIRDSCLTDTGGTLIPHIEGLVGWALENMNIILDHRKMSR